MPYLDTRYTHHYFELIVFPESRLYIQLCTVATVLQGKNFPRTFITQKKVFVRRFLFRFKQ